ncbi:MAG TPA: TraR/DksA C4-type zinc finger protein [Rhodocyclaceae bacterium]|nr:TraR/DksA C4-type zinc finger protein [Rhodocyclaceae bacterium]
MANIREPLPQPIQEHMFSPFSIQQIDQLRGLLDEREELLHEDIVRATNSIEDYQQLAGEVPDTGDQATADLTIDLNHAEVSRDVAELREITAARDRMKEGEYGLCTQCGDVIPFERLRIQPTATRCQPCQAVWEKTYARETSGTSL